MFDIHSHIIYHIDDGSRTPEESLALIRQDRAEGARDIIATPHYYVQYPTDPDRIRAELATIQNMRMQTASMYISTQETKCSGSTV